MSTRNFTPLLLASLLAGCAVSPTPNYDARFGEAVRNAREAQVLNPQGVAHHIPGLEGRAAQEAAARYQDSFKAPPPVVNVINIGGQIGGGR